MTKYFISERFLDDTLSFGPRVLMSGDIRTSLVGTIV
jgi:hypothetical protein